MTDDRTAANQPEGTNPGGYPQQPHQQPIPYGAAGGHGGYGQGGYQPTEQFAAPGQQYPGPTQWPPSTTPTMTAPPPVKQRSGRAGLVAGAIALVLVSGGVGGAVGAVVADNDSNGTNSAVTNSLSAPKASTSPAVNAPAGSVQAVANKVLPSVVMIKVAGARAEGEGSGVVLSSDGLILTNNHVATGAGAQSKLTVAFSDGSTANASLVGADPVSDLAVIKTEKTGLTPIELGDSSNLQVGQQVVAIGSPLGLAGTVTSGIISSLDRPVSTSGDSANQNTVIDAVQTDAAINPGNSGGALVDSDGKLIGINSAIATLGGSSGGGGGGQQSGSIGLGFAIPVDQARRVADELVKTGKATHALIGIQVPSQDDGNGARVIDVTPGSPAEQAGIPKGAVITKVDDRVIDAGDALIAAIRSHAPGDKVKVTYSDGNGGDAKSADVTLGTAPATGAR